MTACLFKRYPQTCMEPTLNSNHLKCNPTVGEYPARHFCMAVYEKRCRYGCYSKGRRRSVFLSHVTVPVQAIQRGTVAPWHRNPGSLSCLAFPSLLMASTSSSKTAAPAPVITTGFHQRERHNLQVARGLLPAWSYDHTNYRGGQER